MEDKKSPTAVERLKNGVMFAEDDCSLRYKEASQRSSAELQFSGLLRERGNSIGTIHGIQLSSLPMQIQSLNMPSLDV